MESLQRAEPSAAFNLPESAANLVLDRGQRREHFEQNEGTLKLEVSTGKTMKGISARPYCQRHNRQNRVLRSNAGEATCIRHKQIGHGVTLVESIQDRGFRGVAHPACSCFVNC